MALTDALDDLISEGQIAPQLAMKILSNFDRSVTDVLNAHVKARLTFKVRVYFIVNSFLFLSLFFLSFFYLSKGSSGSSY